MTLFEKIKILLSDNGVKYRQFKHEPVFTSQDAARIRDEDPRIGAKALVFVADGKPILIVIPGDRKVNTSVFKKTYSTKDLRMATPEEVLEYTSVPIGAVPPFGNVIGLKTYCDKNLLQVEDIAFNAGEHTITIKMRAKDYQELVNPIVGSFT